MSWTFCSSGAAIIKAGVNVNSDIRISGSHLANWSNQAEGDICMRTRRDWLTNYSDLSTLIKYALESISSSMIAKQMVSYDLSTYDSLNEALTIINVQDDIIVTNLKVLEDFKSNIIKTP